MDSISQTIRTLKFIMSGRELRVLFLQTFSALAMIVCFATSIFFASSPAGFPYLNVLLSLSIGILFSVIVVRLFLRQIVKKSSIFLQTILLKSVLTNLNTTIYKFCRKDNIFPFLTIEMPSKTIFVNTNDGFVPDFVIHKCLNYIEDYEKKNESATR